jgi:hypothetical protein
VAKGKWHVVGPEHDLLFLAEWYYGESAAWSHIYWANLDVYGDDFEAIPAGSKVFIPDLGTGPVVKTCAEPGVSLAKNAQLPARLGSQKGTFQVEETAGGFKTLVLRFEGEGQGVAD